MADDMLTIDSTAAPIIAIYLPSFMMPIPPADVIEVQGRVDRYLRLHENPAILTFYRQENGQWLSWASRNTTVSRCM